MERKVGKIIHRYPKISVAIVELNDILKVGNTVHIKGKSTDFRQTVDSIQIDYKNVTEAGSGASIGLKIGQPVREKDEVFVVE